MANPRNFSGPALLRAVAILVHCCVGASVLISASTAFAGRERVAFNDDWRFTQGDPAGAGDSLAYEKLKPWLLPSAAPFTKNNTNVAKAKRPEGSVGADVAYTQSGFDDRAWRKLNLPHDWAIEGPFQYEYDGATGKLKWWGAVWYRKHFTLPASDAGRQIYLDVDGAMSYASVWVNGQFAGGWPYGYASWRVDLTPFVKPGAEKIAERIFAKWELDCADIGVVTETGHLVVKKNGQTEIDIHPLGNPAELSRVQVADVLLGEAKLRLAARCAEELGDGPFTTRVVAWLEQRLTGSLEMDREGTAKAKAKAIEETPQLRSLYITGHRYIFPAAVSSLTRATAETAVGQPL